MVYLLYLPKFDLTRLNNLQQVQQMFLLQGLQNVLKIWRSFDIRYWQVKLTGRKPAGQIMNHGRLSMIVLPVKVSFDEIS